MPDSYLRRFKKRHCPNGVLLPEAFECEPDEDGLSLHIRRPPLHTLEGVRKYQQAFAYPSGTLLGVCELLEFAFSGMKLPDFTPPHDPAEPFANLHCELNPCPTDDQAAQLAKNATTLLESHRPKRAKN